MKVNHNLSEQAQQNEMDKIKAKQVMTQDVLELASLIINARNEEIKKCKLNMTNTVSELGKETVEGTIKFKIERTKDDIFFNLPSLI